MATIVARSVRRLPLIVAGITVAALVATLRLSVSNPVAAMWLPIVAVTAAIMIAASVWAMLSADPLGELRSLWEWGEYCRQEAKETRKLYAAGLQNAAGWVRGFVTTALVPILAATIPITCFACGLIWLKCGMPRPHSQSDPGTVQVTSAADWSRSSRKNVSAADQPGSVQLARASGGVWESDEEATMEDYTSVLALGPNEAMFTIDTEPYIVVRDELGYRRQPLPKWCIARALAGTKNGPRFAFGRDGMIFRQRGEAWEIDETAEMQPADFTRAITLSDRQVLAVTGSNHIYRYSSGQWSMEQLPGSESITALAALKSGTVLIGTRSGRIFRRLDDWKPLPGPWPEKERREGLVGNPITGIAGDSVEDYRVVSQHQVFHLIGGRWQADDIVNRPPPEGELARLGKDLWYNASVGQSCRLIDDQWQVVPLTEQARTTFRFDESQGTIWAIAAGNDRTEVLRYVDTPSYVSRGTAVLKLESFRHQRVRWNRVDVRKTVSVDTAADLYYSADGERWYEKTADVPSCSTLLIKVELSTKDSQHTPSVECVTAHYSPSL